MSKLLPSISGVACFLWVTGWTWIFSEGKSDTETVANQSPINILLDTSQYHVQHPFAFLYSEATPIIEENLIPVIKSLSHEISEQEDSRLIITGVYGLAEKNTSTFANLGLARAASIKSLLEANGVADNLIEIAGLPTENLFSSQGKLTGVIYFRTERRQAVNQQVEPETPASSTRTILHGTKSFYYKYGDYKVEKQHLTYLKTLKEELKKDFKKVAILNGYSTAEEEAVSSRINLAEMRALAIRRYLVDNGVRRSQIEVRAKPSMATNSSEMTVTVQVVEN